MNRQHLHLIFFTLFSFFALWTCAPKPVLKVAIEPADALFARAEQLFQQEAYGPAIEAYQEYVLRFSDTPFAAAALFKTGSAYEALQESGRAQKSYLMLVEKYPGSALVPEARMKLLSLLISDGKYGEAISMGREALKQVTSEIHIAKLYELLGDAYLGAADPVNAIDVFTRAYGESGPQVKVALSEKLKKAVTHLRSPDISSLLRQTQNPLLMGYLLYQSALYRIDEEKYADAEKALSELIDRFPAHAQAAIAKDMLDELHKNFLYHRHLLGCLLPMSGPYQSYGHRALKGIELAHRHVASRHPELTVEIIIRDTESNPKKASAAVKDLADRRVAAIIGPITTPESAAAESQKMGIPIITLTQKDRITHIGEFVFRNFITPQMQVNSIVSHAVETLGLTRFAMLYPNEKYGTTFANLFWDEVLAYGGTVLGVEAYDANHTDFADPIKKLVGLYYDIPEDLKNLAAGMTDERALLYIGEVFTLPESETEEAEEPEAIVDFEAVFIPDSPTKAGLIIPQLAFYDVADVVLLGTNLWHSKRLIEMAGQYVRGAIMAAGFYPESTSEDVRAFVESFEKTYGERPGFIEAIAYDTTMVLFDVVRRSHVQTRKAIKDELISFGAYHGVTGFSTFDGEGECRKKLYLLEVDGESFAEIKRDNQ
jgi:ABC-type branched-subunit amino acid transport system substrate-binding protein/predicted negative regulator of RcsB-dependent stress response